MKYKIDKKRVMEQRDTETYLKLIEHLINKGILIEIKEEKPTIQQILEQLEKGSDYTKTKWCTKKKRTEFEEPTLTDFNIPKKRKRKKRVNYREKAEEARRIIRESTQPLTTNQLMNKIGISSGGTSNRDFVTEIKKNTFGIRYEETPTKKGTRTEWFSCKLDRNYTKHTKKRRFRSKYHEYISERIKIYMKTYNAIYTDALKLAQNDWMKLTKRRKIQSPRIKTIKEDLQKVFYDMLRNMIETKKPLTYDNTAYAIGIETKKHWINFLIEVIDNLSKIKEYLKTDDIHVNIITKTIETK